MIDPTGFDACDESDGLCEIVPGGTLINAEGGAGNGPEGQPIVVTAQSLGGALGYNSSFDGGIAQQFNSRFTAAAIASVLQTSPDNVTTFVTTTPSVADNELDQINVFGFVNSSGANAAQGITSSAGIVWPAIMAGRAFHSSFYNTFKVAPNLVKLLTRVGNTIPDGLANAVVELKNGAYVYNSPQIIAQLQGAADLEAPYYLLVSPSTEIAGTTLNSIANAAYGGQALVYDAEAGTIAPYVDGEALSEGFLEFLELMSLSD